MIEFNYDYHNSDASGLGYTYQDNVQSQHEHQAVEEPPSPVYVPQQQDRTERLPPSAYTAKPSVPTHQSSYNIVATDAVKHYISPLGHSIINFD